MRRFDYSFLKDTVPAGLLNLTSGISSLRTMADFRHEEYDRIFTELESIARIQSVKSSNAIEGIITSDERIISIVNQNSAPLNHDEAEIAGYRDALNAIHMGYEYMDFRQSDILRLHEMLMSIAGYEYGGQYKADDNVILEVDTNGRQRVRFRPVPASETPEAMEQLELAYLAARSNANINQLLLIPCVILDFLCIHPFRDGNGRMSRLLSLLLLYKNGYDAVKYYFILGLPTETYEDIDEMIELLAGIKYRAKQIKNESGLKQDLKLNCTLSIFVPKPFTPFQWVGQDSLETITQKIAYIREKSKPLKSGFCRFFCSATKRKA